jgi:hypothetical protein
LSSGRDRALSGCAAAAFAPLKRQKVPFAFEGRMRAVLPSGDLPHLSLAEASDTFSSKREKDTHSRIRILSL